jgi:prepilin-type N-terminal cleavage/methylation domain-containing protein
MKALRRAVSGFTLVELLVVLGIFVVLSAIMLPVGKRLRESNRATGCQSQLSRVGVALKAYFADEGGVPVVAYNASGKLYQWPGAPAPDYFPGLRSLFTLDYLKNRATLHCPLHRKDSAGLGITTSSLEYYDSYTNRDTTVKPSGEALKQYKYMPYRQALAVDYPLDYLRQLTRSTESVTIAGTAYTVTGRSGGLPPDDTIMTWCSYHADTYMLNKHGQYLVLYWDGSVRYKDKELFTDSTVSPAESWLIKPADTAH